MTGASGRTFRTTVLFPIESRPTHIRWRSGNLPATNWRTYASNCSGRRTRSNSLRELTRRSSLLCVHNVHIGPRRPALASDQGTSPLQPSDQDRYFPCPSLRLGDGLGREPLLPPNDARLVDVARDAAAAEVPAGDRRRKAATAGV